MRVPNPRIRVTSRVAIAIAALSITALLVVPIWRIDLLAPQYPEGLALQIYHDRFEGDVEKVNNLNHYIGMAHIRGEMFPEFMIMRYSFFLLIGWGLIAAVVGRRGALFSWLMVLTAYMLWAMWDMFAWGFKYGHDLDPRAAIKVEGMAYQPPLIGHKKLLNFDAWSLPDTGGWILFGAIALAGMIWFLEWRWPYKHQAPRARRGAAAGTAALAALAAMVLATSCAGSEVPVIDYGKAECTHCRMNVVDKRFAAALTTKGGRQYVFDGPECMVPHVAQGTIAEGQVKAWYVSDMVRPGRLIDATAAFYAHGDAYRSPMRGDVAAFATAAERDSAITASGGEAWDWTVLKGQLAR